MKGLHAPISLRVHTTPIGRQNRKGRPSVRWRNSAVGHRLLAVVMEGEEDGARPFGLGAFRVLARRSDGTYGPADLLALTEPLESIIVGNAVPKRDRKRIITWARGRGLRVLSKQQFFHEVLRPECDSEGTLGATWDWGVLASSLATFWAPSRDREGWTFTLCPVHAKRRTRRSHNPSQHPHCPRLRVRRLTEPFVQVVTWTSPRHRQRGDPPPFPGRFLGLHEKACVLSGEDHTLASACRMLGLTPPASAVSPSLGDRLTALVSRLDAACVLAATIQRGFLRHGAVCSSENEDRRRHHRTPRLSVCEVRTPTTLGKEYLRAMGISRSPDLALADGLTLAANDVHGAAMTAFYPGHARCLVRREPVSGFLCDLRSQYPAVASLLGLWSWWTAARVVVEDATEAAPSILLTARVERFLDRAGWCDLNVLCLVQPQGDWLPVRLRPPGNDDDEDAVLDVPLAVPEHLGPVWYTLADCLISTFRTGRPPRVLRAIRFRPEGTRPGLRPVVFGGGIPLLPDSDLPVELVELRYRLDREGHPHLAQAAKVMANALSFGITAELHAAGGRPVVVYDGVRHFTDRRATYEEPGPFYCPPLAALVTGGARLLLYLLERAVREAGSECAMLTVDCAFITGGDPARVYTVVRDRLEPLNPFHTVWPFLRVDVAHGNPPRPLDYFGVSVNRYCLLDREDVVKPSGQILGSILDPVTHRKTHSGEGTPPWWGEVWSWGVKTAGPGRPPCGPSWLDDPMAYVVSLTTPQEMASLRHLPAGTRPFGQVLLGSPRFAGVRVLPVALLDPARPTREARWQDALTGRPLRPIDDEGRGNIILETYRTFLHDHLTHPEAKSPDGGRRGRLTEIYAVTASRIVYKGKEVVLPVGTEDLGALLGGKEQWYSSTDPVEFRDALAVLRALPPEDCTGLPQRLGVTPRRWRDVFTARATPRSTLRALCIALAEQVRRNGGRLPPTPAAQKTGLAGDGFDLVAKLRTRGWSVTRIAEIAHVARQTPWRWLSGKCYPRTRQQERLREALQGEHQEQQRTTAEMTR